MLAYDVGMGIDLDAAQRVLSGMVKREELSHHQRRGPAYLQFSPPPLRVDQPGPPVSLGGPSASAEPATPRQTVGPVELTLFDFGAISVAYQIPLGGTAADSLESLVPLAELLHENAALLADSRRRVESLVSMLDSAVRRSSISGFVEDYIVYHVRRWATPGAGSLTDVIDAACAGQPGGPHAATIAAILRAERAGLSEQEARDAVSSRITYSTHDAAIIDWNAALVFDAGAEDVLAVLEFANVELLELRFLDERLDGILDRAYQAVHAPRGLIASIARLLPPIPGTAADERRRLATLQMDAALLFEGINNAIKLVGDQYLARLYRLAAQRLHLQDWDASILRKLETVDGIYQKLTDAQATRRMEVLEWIVIILIAVSIVLPFVVSGAK